MAKNIKKTTAKAGNEPNLEMESGLGDIAKLVLGKLDEHGLTLEQAVNAIETASKKPAAKKNYKSSC